jgi:hypothetical protein
VSAQLIKERFRVRSPGRVRVGPDSFDQPDIERSVTVYQVAAEYHVFRPPGTHEGNESGTAAQSGDEPDVVFWNAERCVRGGDADVTRDCEPTADVGTVDCSEDRIFPRFERVEDPLKDPGAGAKLRSRLLLCGLEQFDVGSEGDDVVIAGDSIGAMLLTEPGAGSSPMDLETAAEATEEWDSLSGEKSFGTNAGVADVHLVVAASSPCLRTPTVSACFWFQAWTRRWGSRANKRSSWECAGT